MADPFWGPDDSTSDGTFDLEEFFSLSSAITNRLAGHGNDTQGNNFAGSQGVFINSASTLPDSLDHVSPTDNAPQSDVDDNFVDATTLGSEDQTLCYGQPLADPLELGNQEAPNNLWFGYEGDRELNNFFPPKPTIPYQHQERALEPPGYGQTKLVPEPTFRFALQDEFRQIDNWGFPIPVDPIPDPRFDMGIEAFQLSRLQNQTGSKTYLLQQETANRFRAGLIQYDQQTWLQQYQEAPSATFDFNNQGLKVQPSADGPSKKRRLDDNTTSSDVGDQHPSDSKIKRLKRNAWDLTISGGVAQPNLCKLLLPNLKRSHDDTSISPASNEKALITSQNKRTKTGGKRACMFCRCKGTRCGNVSYHNLALGFES